MTTAGRIGTGGSAHTTEGAASGGFNRSPVYTQFTCELEFARNVVANDGRGTEQGE